VFVVPRVITNDYTAAMVSPIYTLTFSFTYPMNFFLTKLTAKSSGLISDQAAAG
jgi:hypothetical protein